MSGAIPLLPNTPSGRGAQLKKGTGTTLPLPFTRKTENGCSGAYSDWSCATECYCFLHYFLGYPT
jgi:hypothetical protein